MTNNTITHGRTREPFASFAQKTDSEKKQIIAQALERVLAVAAADGGMGLLACHALFEGWLDTLDHRVGQYDDFESKIALVNAPHLAGPKGQNVVERFRTTRRLANAVRHDFLQIGSDAAKMLIQSFLNLLYEKKVLDHGALESFDKRFQQLSQFQQAFEDLLKSDFLRVFEKLQDAVAMKQRMDELQQGIERRSVEIQSLLEENESLKADKTRNEETIRRNDAKIDELRKQRYNLEQTLRQVSGSHAYLEDLKRSLLHCRSQREFEQLLRQLSEEQRDALRLVQRGESFLIRGGAGTGKTLVLISALAKVLEQIRGELGFEPHPHCVLLTYTRTLKNYSHWLGRVLGPELPPERIQTVDEFLLHLAKSVLGPEVRWIFYPGRTDDEKRQLDHLFAGLSHEERDELENFVWALGLDRQRYVDERIPRSGRKNPLPASERAKIWEAGEKAIKEMLESSVFTRNALIFTLLTTLRADEALRGRLRHEVIAVDEVQDLTPAQIGVLGCLTDTLLMAGDTSQSVFQKGFSFAQAGIDVEGRARILKRSYRCTRPVARLANRFLDALESGGIRIPERTPTEGKRDGLPPILREFSRNELFARFDEVFTLFTQVLGYHTGAIAVLSPERDTLERIQNHLGERRIGTILVTESPEWMADEDKVRLCTVQSAKGLDFPAVIFLVDDIPRDWTLEEETRRAHEACLLYVALTRPVETLAVLVRKDTNSTVLKSLKQAFEEISE